MKPKTQQQLDIAFKHFKQEAELFFVKPFIISEGIKRMYSDCLDIMYNLTGAKDSGRGVIALIEHAEGSRGADDAKTFGVEAVDQYDQRAGEAHGGNRDEQHGQLAAPAEIDVVDGPDRDHEGE